MSSPGLRWIVLALVVRVPWTRAAVGVALFMCSPQPRGERASGAAPQTLSVQARQVISLLRRRLHVVPIKLLGERAYSIVELGLHCARQQVTLIAPFHLESMIHQATPVRNDHTIGCPRVAGERLPSLEQVLHDPHTVRERLTLDCYGEGGRTLELCSGLAWWYQFGSTRLPIRSRLDARPCREASA